MAQAEDAVPSSLSETLATNLASVLPHPDNSQFTQSTLQCLFNTKLEYANSHFDILLFLKSITDAWCSTINPSGLDDAAVIEHLQSQNYQTLLQAFNQSDSLVITADELMRVKQELIKCICEGLSVENKCKLIELLSPNTLLYEITPQCLYLHDLKDQDPYSQYQAIELLSIMPLIAENLYCDQRLANNIIACANVSPIPEEHNYIYQVLLSAKCHQFCDMSAEYIQTNKICAYSDATMNWHHSQFLEDINDINPKSDFSLQELDLIAAKMTDYKAKYLEMHPKLTYIEMKDIFASVKLTTENLLMLERIMRSYYHYFPKAYVILDELNALQEIKIAQCNDPEDFARELDQRVNTNVPLTQNILSLFSKFLEQLLYCFREKFHWLTSPPLKQMFNGISLNFSQYGSLRIFLAKLEAMEPPPHALALEGLKKLLADYHQTTLCQFNFEQLLTQLKQETLTPCSAIAFGEILTQCAKNYQKAHPNNQMALSEMIKNKDLTFDDWDSLDQLLLQGYARSDCAPVFIELEQALKIPEYASHNKSKYTD